MREKSIHIFKELGEHLPYSIFGVVVAMLIVGIMTFFAVILNAMDRFPEASGELFHIFHPIHILLSATVTTAMFWKHDRKVVKAFVIGFTGSIGICALSDIFFPYIGGLIAGVPMHLHVCIIEHPHVILPFAFFGIAVGFLIPGVIEKSTQFSHSMHILVSSMASMLYLTTFGFTHWMEQAGVVFLITVFAVLVPCCVSDIVFPLCFVKHSCCPHKSIKE